eukprot:TRINITY_DN4476_c0_g1_i12.p2 TRINITY_DN4476_c0_g1~~TRINITY_DN4476_c0_g1_i12.p2  ORF type:complete len:161 (-),score=15.00 TRINITY_DN4476_c0_g1_i12:600-1082(-)
MIGDDVESSANALVISNPIPEACIQYNLKLDPKHIKQHPKAHTNCYGVAIEFHVKARLVTDPFRHYAGYGDAAWSKEEIGIFLGRCLIESKNLAKVSKFLPHKRLEQVIQFYYDMKILFDLKKSYKCFSDKKDRWGKKLAYSSELNANIAMMKVSTFTTI